MKRVHTNGDSVDDVDSVIDGSPKECAFDSCTGQLQHYQDQLKQCQDVSTKMEKQLQRLDAKETPYFKQFVKSLDVHLEPFQYLVCTK